MPLWLISIGKFLWMYKKYAAIAVGIVVIFILWQRDRTRMWEKGAESGGQRMQGLLEDEYKKKWSVMMKGIVADQTKVKEAQAKADEQAKINQAVGQQLVRERKQLDVLYAKLEAVAVAKVEAGYEEGKRLTNANSDESLRQLSRELAADKLRRDSAAPTAVPK